MASEHKRIPVASIQVGVRARKDKGDIGIMVRSMGGAAGQIHPIVVMPLVGGKFKLLVGERRLLAARQLGWDKIDSMLCEAGDAELMEHDENECRKDFTVSERVEAAKKARLEIGVRSGERTDLAPNGAQLNGRTDDHVAASAGFGSPQTFRRAEHVVDNAIPEIVEAMDAEEVSVSDAAAVADLPAAEQRKALRKKKSGAAKTLKAGAIKETRSERLARLAHEQNGKPKEDTTPADETVDDTIKRVNSEIESFCRGLTAYVEENMPKDPWLNVDNITEGAKQKFKDGCGMLRTKKCTAKCPACKGAKKDDDGKKCRPCIGTGRVPKLQHDMMS